MEPERNEVNIEPGSEPNTEPGKQPVKYASPVKRTWAWVGVVYAVTIMLLTTYGMARGGRFLMGIGPLMVTPALVGVGVTAILRYRDGTGRGGLPACVLVAGGCFLLSVLNLFRGVPVLLAQLMG